MMDDLSQVARKIETHEALAWAACIEAAASLPGNPLGAQVDRSGNTPLCALTAFDFSIFNRVIALGVETPATEDDIDNVLTFYAGRAQSRYLVEVTPASEPRTLVDSLVRRGLRPTGHREAKCWRDVDDIPSPPLDIEVRELSVNDREQWTAVNIAAWETPSFFGPWFGATLGRDGFRHYGVFDGDLLVSTAALYITGDVAWSGFSATRPEHRGHRYQVATHIKRLQDAAAIGCRIVHTETAAGTPESPNPSLRNELRVGFSRIYDKENFALTSDTTAAS